MKINISRERWVIILRNEKIFCGLARNYKFKPLNKVGDTAIKTYLSENKAMASFFSSWGGGDKLVESGEIRFVKIIESIKERIENERN